MRSTEVIIILLQQYLDTWSSSRTLPGSSPPLTRVSSSVNLSPMSFPHVKQRMGTSKQISPVALLSLPSRARTAELLGLGLSRVSGEEVLAEGVDLLLHLGPLGLVHVGPRQGHGDGVGLTHETTSGDADVDVVL